MALSSLNGAVNRPDHLPGLVVFYGPSGLGKTTAALIAMTETRAYLVQAKSSWTRKAFYLSILNVMGIVPAKTLYEMEEQVAKQLATSNRPLIIDEADHLVNKGIIEIVRDIYEGSNAAIMLIGEENLPNSLSRYERIHNRVLEWVPAVHADLEDTKALAEIFCDKVQIAEDLLEHIHSTSNAVVRRICVNLERVQQAALTDNQKQIDLETWGNRPLYTGEAPKRGSYGRT